MLLTSRLPHLVIDGVLVAAAVLGSDRVVFALDEHARGTARALQQALAERDELRQRGAPEISVSAVPAGYLSGQETALVNALDGGPAKPTTTPPYPFERGLRGRPTLVSNSETFAQLALVARHGADWFRAIGTSTDPGTRLVTVGGAVSYPGVVEVAGGTTLRQLISASGGLAEPIQGVLLGGYAGTWLSADALDLRLDAHALLERGLRLGSGIVVLLPAISLRRRRGRRRRPLAAARERGAVRSLHQRPAGDRRRARGPLRGRRPPPGLRRASRAGASWSSAAAPARCPTARRAS